MKYRVLVLFVGMCFFAGCAKNGTSTFKYTPPKEYKIENEVLIDKGYSVVWDELVRELSKSFFTINNIDKNSRIINVSFYANNPGRYVDCGHSYRSTSRGDEHREYDYEVASSSNYVLEDRGLDYFEDEIHVDRRTSLEGKMNIYLAPEGENKTLLSVNVRYILSTDGTFRGVRKHISGNVVDSRQLDSFHLVDSFSSKERYIRKEANGPDFICEPKGVLEKEILNLVKE